MGKSGKMKAARRVTPCAAPVVPTTYQRAAGEDVELQRTLEYSRQLAEQEAADLERALASSLDCSHEVQEDMEDALQLALAVSRQAADNGGLEEPHAEALARPSAAEAKESKLAMVIELNRTLVQPKVQNSTSSASQTRKIKHPVVKHPLAPRVVAAAPLVRRQDECLRVAIEASRQTAVEAAQLQRVMKTSMVESKKVAEENECIALLMRASALAAEAEDAAMAQAIAASLSTDRDDEQPVAATAVAAVEVSIATPPSSPRASHRDGGDEWTVVEELDDDDWLCA